MYGKERSQADISERFSDDEESSPRIACTAEEDRARQEYALQADLAYQVQRFGVGVHPAYGEQDFSVMDLTTAIQIVEESRERWLSLPSVIRDRYHSFKAVEDAARSGELEQILKAAGIAEVPSAVSAASPSDSAADSTAQPS